MWLLDEEEVFFQESGSVEDIEFDGIVGALEEILLGDAFTTIQKAFCDEHCGKPPIVYFIFIYENRIIVAILFDYHNTSQWLFFYNFR